MECYPSLPQANAVLLVCLILPSVFFFSFDAVLVCLLYNLEFKALFHITSVQNYFLKHMCATDYCLSCEIGFLYRMLIDRSPTQPASVIFFLKSS